VQGEGLSNADLMTGADLATGNTTALANAVALPWESLEVRSGAALGNTNDNDDEAAFQLVYTGTTPLDEQQTFDATVLDDQGAVLDDQAVADDMQMPAEFNNLVKVSAYNEVDVANTAGDDLGEITDALVDLQQGRVRFVLVDVGGFLGIGERTVAIPVEAFQIDVTPDGDTVQESVTLDVSQSTLENAPEFNFDQWTPNVNAGWDTDWNDFWSTEMDLDLGD
jgi:sporulation protein YlmC with PRC-barrel domain